MVVDRTLTRIDRNAERFFVLTGGPGSGESAVIDALHRKGYARSIEAGRGIIQDQMEIGGPALPWRDPGLFAEMMMSWDMRSYHDAQQSSGPVFFDRGVVDVVGYLRLRGLPVPAHIQKAVETFRYNRRVLVAPPWEEIYEQDRERRQDFAEAARTCEVMIDTYSGCGYEVVEIPCASVEQRTRFVLDAVGIFH